MGSINAVTNDIPGYVKQKADVKLIMSRIRTFLKILFFVLLIPVLVSAQDDEGKKTKKQRKAEAKKEQRVQDSQKAEIKGKKRHMKLQDKETRKRMKKNKKKGTAYVSRRPGFFQRLFKGGY